MAGWVKLHRKMLKWGWYDDPNTFRLFITLLMMANHADKEWMGKIIPAGSLATGRSSLAKTTGLTEMQVRTSLSKLKSTSEITIKTSNKYSIISITNWNKYQEDNQQNNQRITNEQPTDNQQVTTNKNVKKERSKEVLEATPTPPQKNGLDFNLWNSVPSDQVLKDYKKTRGKQLTQTAINRMAVEINKANADGVTADDCLSVCCEAGWQGFKYEWYQNREKGNGSQKSNYTQNEYQLIGGGR